ncbi:MAG: DUF4932 domain-containing protein [Treponema sp.]|nr:DUF4932 domain-containing protein [Treponema sp.]
MSKFLKSACTLALLITSISLFSCSTKGGKNLTPVNIQPIEVEKDGFTYKMDPRLELLLIGLRLAENPFFYNNVYGDNEYVSSVDSFFEKHKEHSFVKSLKNLNKLKDFRLEAILGLADYISEDFTQINFPENKCPAYIKDVWKNTNLKKLISDMNDFALTSKYDRFLLVHDADIKKALYDAREFFTVNEDFLPYLQELFSTKENPLEINFCVTPLLAGRFMVLPASTSLLFSPYYNYNSSNDIYFINYYVESIAYRLIYDNWEKLSAPANAYINKLYQQTQNPNKITDYVCQTTISNIISISTMLNYAEDFADEDQHDQLRNYIFNEEIYKPYMSFYNQLLEFFENRQNYQNYYDFFDQKMIEILETL